jgi:hypothetical protein
MPGMQMPAVQTSPAQQGTLGRQGAPGGMQPLHRPLKHGPLQHGGPAGEHMSP